MLRPYQLEAVEGLRESFKKGYKRIVLQAATGSGKTVMASEIVRGAVAKGNPVLFVAHRRELIHQAAAKLKDFGISTGLILAEERPKPRELVQVGSIQTIAARYLKKGETLPSAAVVIYDEGHHALAQTYVRLAEQYPNAALLGLTATPVRGDGKGLGHMFQDMVMGPSITKLTEQGYLVPVRYFAPSMPDLYGVKVTAGDYNQGQLDERMDKPKLVGDIVANWGEIAPERKTIVFASSVKHSIHLAEQFQAAGVNAAHLDGETPIAEREEILGDLRRGKIQVLTNCMVCTEGFDLPDLSCCVLARPTKSLGLYLQMAGRVLRPSPDKQDAILIDHSGAYYDHGPLDSDFEWSLETSGKIQDRETQRKEGEPKPITCQNCFAIYEKQRICPNCGHVPERSGREVQQVEGTLGEVTSDKPKRKEYSQDEKRLWYQMLKHIQLEKNRQKGWTAYSYKDKFGTFPRGFDNLGPIYPSLEVSRYVKHKAIRYAKSKTKGPRQEPPLFGAAHD